MIPDTSSKPRHDTEIDLLRLVSAFFVVLTHVERLYSFSSVFYVALSRSCVPAFFLITGWYLSVRRFDLPKLLSKCFHLFLTMVLWSGVYFLYGLFSGKHPWAGPADLLSYLLTQPGHLWYSYAAIGLYLFSPALAVFSMHASRQAFRYVLFLTFLIGSPITIALRTSAFPLLAEVLEKMKIDPTLGFVFCFLFAGYYRRFGLSVREKRFVFLCALAGFLFPLLLFFLLGERGEGPVSLISSFFSPNALALGVASLVLVKELRAYFPEFLERFQIPLRRLGKCASGIYYIHFLILELIDPFLRTAFSPIPLFFALPLRAAIAFLVSLGVVAILRKLRNSLPF